MTALAAGLLMFADTSPAAAPDAPAAQTEAAKPEMKKVCVRSRSTDSNLPRTVCKMMPVKTDAEVAKTDEPAKPASE
ncbi:MAG TPA: hypothetical protein VFW47_10100 [Phenylobacterium sp.]|nr:hypothetical protein [Phenylobacterium sp.]